MGSTNSAKSSTGTPRVRIRSRSLGRTRSCRPRFRGHFVWQHYAPTVARHPQYRVTADNIQITPPPPWIRSDIKTEVLRDAGLVGNLSVLDDWQRLQQRVRDAFEMHPWVASVRRIDASCPRARCGAEVSPARGGCRTIDARRRHFCRSTPRESACPTPTSPMRTPLPAANLRRDRPALVGDAWADPRVVGGAAAGGGARRRLGKLRLVEIVPSPQPKSATTPASTHSRSSPAAARGFCGAPRPATKRRSANRRSTTSGSGCSTTPPARQTRSHRS